MWKGGYNKREEKKPDLRYTFVLNAEEAKVITAMLGTFSLIDDAAIKEDMDLVKKALEIARSINKNRHEVASQIMKDANIMMQLVLEDEGVSH